MAAGLLTSTCRFCSLLIRWDTFMRVWRSVESGDYNCPSSSPGSLLWHFPTEEAGTANPPGSAASIEGGAGKADASNAA